MTDALKEVGRLPEVVSWTRDGNNIKFHTEANNNSFDITYVLDGTIEWKDVPSSQYRVSNIQ